MNLYVKYANISQMSMLKGIKFYHIDDFFTFRYIHKNEADYDHRRLA